MFVLHVGRHKCGSSSIQRVLSEGADRLREHGILYPQAARPNAAHHPLAKSLGSGRFDELDEIIELERRHPAQKLVLSSEDLGSLPPPRIAQLKERIGPCETLIVVYIRDLLGWLPSKYNEVTKSGASTCDFDRFFEADQRSTDWSASRYCQQWASVFGWHNLRVRSLDSRSLQGGTLIEDFLSILGVVPSVLGNAEGLGLQPRNVSVGWKVLEVLRSQFAELARHPEHMPLDWEQAARIRNLAIHILTGMGLSGERAQYLTAGQSEMADRQYRLDLASLNERLVGPKLPVPERPLIAERPFLPALDRIPIDERADIARRMQRALFDDGPRPAGLWDRRFTQAGIGSDMRRCIVDAVARPVSSSLRPPSVHPAS